MDSSEYNLGSMSSYSDLKFASSFRRRLLRCSGANEVILSIAEFVVATFTILLVSEAFGMLLVLSEREGQNKEKIQDLR